MQNIYRMIAVIFYFSFILFLYIDEQHQVLLYRRQIPPLEQEVRALQEDNLRLEYALQSFLSPDHLLKLSQDPTYGHLHYAKKEEVIKIKE